MEIESQLEALVKELRDINHRLIPWHCPHCGNVEVMECYSGDIQCWKCDGCKREVETYCPTDKAANILESIAPLIRALEFYARESGYNAGVDMPASVYMDGGHQAQEALSAFKAGLEGK